MVSGGVKVGATPPRPHITRLISSHRARRPANPDPLSPPSRIVRLRSRWSDGGVD